MTKPIDRDPIYRRRAFDADIIELCCRWHITYRSFPAPRSPSRRGAGVVAGEELAHHLLDRDQRESLIVPPGTDGGDRRDLNADLGGNDFGVNGASSWDAGDSSDGGGDWSWRRRDCC